MKLDLIVKINENGHRYSDSKWRCYEDCANDLDENLLVVVDKAAKQIGTTRSGFTHDALQKALEKLPAAEFE